jgi:hypothetical protein
MLFKIITLADARLIVELMHGEFVRNGKGS